MFIFSHIISKMSCAIWACFIEFAVFLSQFFVFFLFLLSEDSKLESTNSVGKKPIQTAGSNFILAPFGVGIGLLGWFFSFLVCISSVVCYFVAGSGGFRLGWTPSVGIYSGKSNILQNLLDL